ncbi:MAG: DUF484 family protein [Alphaproteobacteria bacterium]|nr:DUF484 family protein [Alphaproteobacteria bacterium]
MVDRPRDQPRPNGESAPARTAPREVTGRDVLAYLRHHPDFLDRHPEATRLLRAPTSDRGEGVLDFQRFLVERLRGELLRLQGEQKTLLVTSRGNLASQARVHKAVLAIVSATSFEQLLQIVTTDLAVLLDVDVVTLGVESAATPTTRLMQGIQLLRSGIVEAVLGPERMALFRAGVHGDPALFGAASGLVRSQALLRLSFGRTAPVGLLCIGTRKPDTFHPGLGTELLGFLARALGITIGQWLDPGR